MPDEYHLVEPPRTARASFQQVCRMPPGISLGRNESAHCTSDCRRNTWCPDIGDCLRGERPDPRSFHRPDPSRVRRAFRQLCRTPPSISPGRNESARCTSDCRRNMRFPGIGKRLREPQLDRPSSRIQGPSFLSRSSQASMNSLSVRNVRSSVLNPKHGVRK